MRTIPGCGKVDKLGRRKARTKTLLAVKRLCEMLASSPEELFPGFVRERLTGKSLVRQTTEMFVAWRAEVVQAVAMMVEQIDYYNFKDAVHGNLPRDEAYLKVWTAMRELQLSEKK